MRFRDWRQPSLIHAGVVVSAALILLSTRFVRVQRSGFHGVSFVALADIVEVVADKANSKARI